jgi:hypothetical protein
MTATRRSAAPRWAPLELLGLALVVGAAAAVLASTCAPRRPPADTAQQAALLARLAAVRDSAERLRRTLTPQVETVRVQITRWLPAAQALAATTTVELPTAVVRPVLLAAIETAGACQAALTTCEAAAAQHTAAQALSDSILDDHRARIRALTRGCRLLGPVPCPVLTVGPSLTVTPTGFAPGLSLTLGFPLPLSRP